MHVYTILQDEAEDAVFIDEGFSWGGFFVAPVWLAYHGLWPALLGYAAALLGIWLGMAGGFITASGVFWLCLLVHFYVGLEGNYFRRLALLRKGYGLIDIMAATELEEAELRYFARPAGVSGERA